LTATIAERVTPIVRIATRDLRSQGASMSHVLSSTRSVAGARRARLSAAVAAVLATALVDSEHHDR